MLTSLQLVRVLPFRSTDQQIKIKVLQKEKAG